MSSGTKQIYNGSFLGALADITVDWIPFRPGSIKFWNATPRWGVKIEGEKGMLTNNYLSSVAADTGVTITDDGFDVANGADVNQNGVRTYFEAIEGTSEQNT
jgi:hypothetical protein